MADIQELLDQEAGFSNAGETEKAKKVQGVIRNLRNDTYKPCCFGEDDCSTMMLVRCAWRFDCGTSS